MGAGEQPVVDNFQERAPAIEMNDDEQDVQPDVVPEQDATPKKGADARAARGGKDAAPPEPAKDEPPPQRRKVKLGDMEVDLDDEEFRKIKAVDIVRGGQKALREAAELRKQAERMQMDARRVVQALKEQPDWALKSVGMSEKDQVAWAERLLAQEMIRQGVNPQTGEAMSPDQIRLYQLQSERDEQARRAQEYERQRMTEEREAAKVQLRQKFDREITDALRAGGIPPTNQMIGRLAQAYLDFDFEVPAKDLIPMVMEDFKKELEVTFASLSPQDILQLLPKGFLEALRKHDLAQAKAGPAKLPQGKPQVIPQNRDPDRARTGQFRKRITSPVAAQKALDDWANGR